MYVCNECGQDIQPVNHNGRGNRCPLCWSADVVEKPDQPSAEPKPRRRKAPK